MRARRIARTKRQDRDCASHYAMGVFIADAAYQRRDNFSVGQGPVGDGVGCVVAGDQCAGHQEQDGGGRGGEGEAVEAWGSGDSFLAISGIFFRKVS